MFSVTGRGWAVTGRELGVTRRERTVTGREHRHSARPHPVTHSENPWKIRPPKGRHMERSHPVTHPAPRDGPFAPRDDTNVMSRVPRNAHS